MTLPSLSLMAIVVLERHGGKVADNRQASRSLALLRSVPVPLRSPGRAVVRCRPVEQDEQALPNGIRGYEWRRSNDSPAGGDRGHGFLPTLNASRPQPCNLPLMQRLALAEVVQQRGWVTAGVSPTSLSPTGLAASSGTRVDGWAGID